MVATDELLSDENLVTGIAARRAVQGLANMSGRIDIVCNDASQYSSRVLDQMGRQSRRLEIDQPVEVKDNAPICHRNDSLRVNWSDAGMRYTTSARVIEVYDDGGEPSYQIELDERIYRHEEKRAAQRMPVTADDGLTASLSLRSARGSLTATLKDISRTGVRLALPTARVLDTDLEPRITARLALSFRGTSEPARSLLTIIWMQQVNDQTTEFGCAWKDAADSFIEQIDLFIAAREE